MKRIIALLLVIGCILSFAACDNNQKDEAQDFTKHIENIKASLEASAPDIADITVTLDSEIGTLEGTYNVVYNEDGSATVTYSYERFNSFNDEAITDGIKSTYTGTVTVAADGTLSEELDGTASVEAVTFEINLDKDKLDSVSASAGILSAKVKAADTESVLGVAIGYDVDILITAGADGVVAIAISYNSASGPVEISASYTYIEEEPEEEEGTETVE